MKRADWYFDFISPLLISAVCGVGEAPRVF